jgi:PTS system N-acetylgalactosamine-specific IIA component
MREVVDREGVGVVFTDLPAGSCTMAARRLQRERPELLVVTGTNLATLLDFVFPAGDTTRSAAEHAVEKGRAALIVTGKAGGA